MTDKIKYAVKYLIACVTVLGSLHSTAQNSQAPQLKLSYPSQAESKLKFDPRQFVAPEKNQIDQEDLIQQLQDRYKLSPEGPRTGGGGNTMGADFSDVAVKSLQNAVDLSPSVRFGNRVYNVKSLLSIATKMKVYVSKKPLFLRKNQVEAINYPEEQVVVIHGPSWQAMNEVEKSRLAIHEVLGLAGVEDRNYELSRMLSKKLMSCRTHGCDAIRNAKTMAVLQAILNIDTGMDFNDDLIECSGFSDLYSLEKLTDNTFKVVCGSGSEVESAILQVVRKKGYNYEDGDPGMYEVKMLQGSGPGKK